MKIFRLILYVLVLLLIPLAFSRPAGGLAQAGGCVNNLFDFATSGVGVYIGVAFSLMILVIILSYLIGTLTSNPNLLSFYKDEIYHVLFSAILIASISGVFFFSCSAFGAFLDFTLTQVGTSYCYTGLQSPSTAATCYFNVIESRLKNFVNQGLRQSIQYEMDSTLLIVTNNPLSGSTYVPVDAYKKAYASQLDFIINSFAMSALVSISIQKVFLTFSTDFIKWLIPIAFFLRILAPTRQMGNFLIGVALALYIFLPSFYAINGAMDELIFKDCNTYSGLIRDQVMGGFLATPGGLSIGDPCQSSTSFWVVASAIPQAFFLPNLTLALTITFISGINKALRVLG